MKNSEILSLQRFTHQELRQLKLGDWVSWCRNALEPLNHRVIFEDDGDTVKEARIIEPLTRGNSYVAVFFNGQRTRVQKNRLYKIAPVVLVENLAEVENYDN